MKGRPIEVVLGKVRIVLLLLVLFSARCALVVENVHAQPFGNLSAGRKLGVGIQAGLISGFSIRLWFADMWGLEGDAWFRSQGSTFGGRVLLKFANDSMMDIYLASGVGLPLQAPVSLVLEMVVAAELTSPAFRVLAFNMEVGIGIGFGSHTLTLLPIAALGTHYYF